VIVGVWQVLVLVGAGAAYLGLIRKGEGAVFALLASFGTFAVLALGSLSIETSYTTTNEWAVTILFAVVALVSAIAFPFALTKSGVYAEEDDDEDDPRGDEYADSDSDFLDPVVGRMS